MITGVREKEKHLKMQDLGLELQQVFELQEDEKGTRACLFFMHPQNDY